MLFRKSDQATLDQMGCLARDPSAMEQIEATYSKSIPQVLLVTKKQAYMHHFDASSILAAGSSWQCPM
jgi:hypothetical protein